MAGPAGSRTIRSKRYRDAGIGLSVLIGLTDETDHIGIAIRTGVRF